MEDSDNQSRELQLVKEFQSVYSPTTILGIYANAIKTPADNKIILAKGEYHSSINAKEYNGYYYEDLKSTYDNRFLKIKVTALLRSQLDGGLIYLFKGYVEKRISNSSIDLIFVVDEILQKEENPISAEDLKRFEVIQKKVSKGYKDFQAFVKDSIFNNKLLRIANIYGTTGIVNKDFEAGIGQAKVRFNISESRINLSSKSDIINKIKTFNTKDCDVIALVRGGGDKSSLEILNDPEIGEEILKLKPLFITALGHVVNDSLLDKIADKKFHLPHDYGNSLKVWVDEAVAEQAKSKSLFIDQVKKDLTKTFEDQIKTKDETIKNLQKTYEESSKQKEEAFKNFQKNFEESKQQMIKMATAEMQTKFETMKAENSRLNDQLKQASQKSSNVIIWIIVALVIGLIIGIVISSG